MKAFFAWQERDLLRGSQGSGEGRAELEERWQRMKDRICVLGPFPRYVFDENNYSGRRSAINSALFNTSDADFGRFAKKMFGKAEWGEDGTADKLIRLVRVLEEERVVRDASVVVRPNAGNGGDAESCRNFPVSVEVEKNIAEAGANEEL
ncbi:retrotransposon hot spot (RHS) protein [Trypanosoma rangeli]|uniref:Retrotransposon hot spot (RHS) protein n=1 Tax=Trypanosoma rangeli TaxID=5698 RepID=A0A422MUI0_TRYRA|nr:retrotransposon hot spot (RHS) protein [Trypanosoma rangeli]RNE96884.1 retrotransposon hot spot (RHS) protein [Trypanosoma rangeli]|eukprot:RNE96884.1 retrotransposon hot spot (RHS) protein [Trypanosoma rangeli]